MELSRYVLGCRYALIKLFVPVGEIERCQYMFHMHGEQRGAPRGFAFVEMKTKEASSTFAL